MSDLAALRSLVEKLDRLHAKSTQGEWFALCETSRIPVVKDDGRRGFAEQRDANVLIGDQEDRVCCCHDGECSPEANAEAIAALHNAWPFLSSSLRAVIKGKERE